MLFHVASMPYGGTTCKRNVGRWVRNMSPVSVELEPIAVESLVNVEGWNTPVPARATVRWKRVPAIVVIFSPTPQRGVKIESLTVEGSPSRPITSADLRGFQFAQLTGALVTFLGTWDPDSAGVASVTVLQLTRADLADSIARRRAQDEAPWLTGMSDPFREILTDPEELAALRAHGPRTAGAVTLVNYLLDYAASAGLAPHSFVRDVLDLPKSTASRWISAARELRSPK